MIGSCASSWRGAVEDTRFYRARANSLFGFLSKRPDGLVGGDDHGLFGGFATAAYIDLIMRSCPKGLEGTAMMVANTSTFALAGSAGNLLGSWIYSRGGFASAVTITTLATALIVPVLRSVPAELTARHDGEQIEPDAAQRARS